MKVIYVAETFPQRTLEDSPSLDKLLAVRYLYDLELDPQHRILGGEWYTNKHPDFLWLPPEETQPLSEGDQILQARDPHDHLSWNASTEVIPPEWAQAAQTASQYRQPLKKIVDTLFQISGLAL